MILLEDKVRCIWLDYKLPICVCLRMRASLFNVTLLVYLHMHSFSIGFERIDVYVNISEALVYQRAMIDVVKSDLIYLDVCRGLNQSLPFLELCFDGNLSLDKSALLRNRHTVKNFISKSGTSLMSQLKV